MSILKMIILYCLDNQWLDHDPFARFEMKKEEVHTERPHKSLGYLSPLLYAEMKKMNAALSTPASETSNQIEAQPVVDKAIN